VDIAGSGRRSRRSINIWPGFVDALATLLMVLIFVLLVFVLAQFFLSEALSGREAALKRLEGQVAELAGVLALERAAKDDLGREAARLAAELEASLAARAGLARDLAAKDADAARLAADVAALAALKAELEKEAAALAGRAETAEAGRIELEKLAESTRAQVALLNQQIAALQAQLRELSQALAASEKQAQEQGVQIATLGSRLNAALAGKVQELARYRSEFFGRMREILGNNPDIRIVGDRFVFPSEVLFPVGQAEINDAGRAQLGRAAAALKQVAAKIPADIDWILLVEGHTDRTPIATTQFPSNWELSQARAMSVIRLLIDAGIPPNRLAAAGYGEFQPLDPGVGEAAFSRNRRIELKLTQR
jgi:chemotaxis protein MotB